MHWLVAATLMLGISGCGGGAGASEGASLVLQIHLPSSLSRTEARRSRFLQRVTQLELEIQTADGQQESLRFAPADWDKLVLPEARLPSEEGESLQVRAKVWDLDRSGVARPAPALTGKVALRSGDVAKQGPTQLHLRLVLRLPVSEYD